MNQQGFSQEAYLEDEETRKFPAALHRCRRSSSVSFGPSVAMPFSPPMRGPIWIIDDSPTIRAMITLALAPCSVPVQAFPDGYAVFSSIREHSQERLAPLIFLDIEMPGLDGYTVLRYLRAIPSSSCSAIVMLSASEREEVRQKSLLAGATAFLLKPVSQEMLLKMVGIYLDPLAFQIPEGLRGRHHG